MRSEPTYSVSVQGPAGNGNNPKSKWRVRQRRDELTGASAIEIRFERRDGSWHTCRFPGADRDSPYKLLRLLHSLDARLPNEGMLARRFADDLIRATPATAVIATTCPGWRDHARGFVMPGRMYGTAEHRFVWEGETVSPDKGALSGSLDAYRRGVLAPARQSTHLTVAILLALAAPLVGYVEGRQGRRLLAETALMHWAGETSTGKTTVARVAQSVIGCPAELSDYRLTERSIAEEAYHHNDLVAVFDETEHLDSAADLFAKMKMISQCITGGRSKQITRTLRGSLPDLRWTCFGVSTGPISQASAASQLNKLRHGQNARFVDIIVQAASDGGIFDELVGFSEGAKSEASARLVRQVDECISAHHGVLLDQWISHLLSRDVSPDVERLTDHFAAHLAGTEGGLNGRLARKFAILYAAASIAIDAGLLPWSKAWARYAITRIYRNALAVRDPAITFVNRTVLLLNDAVCSGELFPRVRETHQGVPSISLAKEAVGFIVKDGRRKGGYLIPERLRAFGAREQGIQRRVAEAICEPNESPSTSGAPLFRAADEGRCFKVRAWRFTPKSLASAVELARACPREYTEGQT